MLRHSWDISPKEAVALQKALAAQVRQEPIRRRVSTVAGTDCAFMDGGRRIVAVAVLCDAASMEVIVSASVTRRCRFPYVPGLLSFREAPAIIAAVEKLPIRPDLLMIDGQGLAHPRGFGIACHIGVWLDIPTIGVAKSLLCGEHRPPGRARGSQARIGYKGTVVGSAVRTRDGVKPVYVSVGHRITLQEAVRWALRAAVAARLPEPTRRAHQYVTRLAKR